MLDIFIPSRGRATASQQVTLREMRLYSTRIPTLVVPENEVHEYRSVCEEVDVGRVVGCPVQGIGHVRQWILHRAVTPHVMMLDDDMYFSVRPDPCEPELEKCDDLDPMFQTVEEILQAGYIHGGVSARQGNNHTTNGYKDIARVNNVHFFNRDICLNEGADFTKLPVMEDFFVSLHLLTLGYANRVIYEWCWNQQGSGNVGGCSLYRTRELQAEAAHALKAEFPDFVRVTEKFNKSGHGVFDGSRTDVNIQWRKAFATRSDRRILSIPQVEPDMNSYSENF